MTLTNHLLLDLHPFGIAFVNDKVFAVSDDNHGKVVLATLDDTLLSAQLIVDMSWDGMRCPKGLACVDNTLYVADMVRVLSITLPHGLRSCGVMQTVQGGFVEVTCVDARELAQSPNGARHEIAASDRGRHTVHVLECEAGAVVKEVVHGQAGQPGNLDGPASYFLLDEPVGVFYFGGTLLVASHGGAKNGSICTITSPSFGLECMVAINDLYKAVGYVPPKNAELGSDRHLPFKDAVALARKSMDFWLDVCNKRSEQLSGLSVEGPQGTPCLHSIRGGDITVSSCEGHIEAFEQSGHGHLLDLAKLHSFANESPVEHGFGDWDVMSQSGHPSQREHGGRKGSSLIHSLRKHCKLAVSLFTSKWTQYQAVQTCDIDAEGLVASMEAAHKAAHPPAQPMSAGACMQVAELQT